MAIGPNLLYLKPLCPLPLTSDVLSGWSLIVFTIISLPPTKLNKLIPREISSSAVQANSSHAWVQKCMGAQKREERVPTLPLSLFHME